MSRLTSYDVLTDSHEPIRACRYTAERWFLEVKEIPDRDAVEIRCAGSSHVSLTVTPRAGNSIEIGTDAQAIEREHEHAIQLFETFKSNDAYREAHPGLRNERELYDALQAMVSQIDNALGINTPASAIRSELRKMVVKAQKVLQKADR